MVTNKTYPRVSEICIVSCYLQNVLPRTVGVHNYWPKPAWVPLRWRRSLPFHPVVLILPFCSKWSLVFRAFIGVHQCSRFCCWQYFSHVPAQLVPADLTRGTSKVGGTWARTCRRRHGGCVQVWAEAVLPLLQCNKGILLLEPSRKELAEACQHQQLHHSLSQDRQSLYFTDPEQMQFSRYLLTAVYPSLILKKATLHLAAEQVFV